MPSDGDGRQYPSALSAGWIESPVKILRLDGGYSGDAMRALMLLVKVKGRSSVSSCGVAGASAFLQANLTSVTKPQTPVPIGAAELLRLCCMRRR